MKNNNKNRSKLSQMKSDINNEAPFEMPKSVYIKSTFEIRAKLFNSYCDLFGLNFSEMYDYLLQQYKKADLDEIEVECVLYLREYDIRKVRDYYHPFMECLFDDPNID